MKERTSGLVPLETSSEVGLQGALFGLSLKPSKDKLCVCKYSLSPCILEKACMRSYGFAVAVHTLFVGNKYILCYRESLHFVLFFVSTSSLAEIIHM